MAIYKHWKSRLLACSFLEAADLVKNWKLVPFLGVFRGGSRRAPVMFAGEPGWRCGPG